MWLSVHVLAQGLYISIHMCVCFWCGADKPTCFADCCGSLIFSVQQEKGGHAIRHFHSISTSRNAAGTLLGLFVCYTPALGFYTSSPAPVSAILPGLRVTSAKEQILQQLAEGITPFFSLSLLCYTTGGVWGVHS